MTWHFSMVKDKKKVILSTKCSKTIHLILYGSLTLQGRRGENRGVWSRQV